jgi:hypothetical protein
MSVVSFSREERKGKLVEQVKELKKADDAEIEAGGSRLFNYWKFYASNYGSNIEREMRMFLNQNPFLENPPNNEKYKKQEEMFLTLMMHRGEDEEIKDFQYDLKNYEAIAKQIFEQLPSIPRQYLVEDENVEGIKKVVFWRRPWLGVCYKAAKSKLLDAIYIENFFRFRTPKSIVVARAREKHFLYEEATNALEGGEALNENGKAFIKQALEALVYLQDNFTFRHNNFVLDNLKLDGGEVLIKIGMEWSWDMFQEKKGEEVAASYDAATLILSITKASLVPLWADDLIEFVNAEYSKGIKTWEDKELRTDFTDQDNVLSCVTEQNEEVINCMYELNTLQVESCTPARLLQKFFQGQKRKSLGGEEKESPKQRKLGLAALKL